MSAEVAAQDMPGTMAVGTVGRIQVEEAGRLISEPIFLLWQLAWLLREEAVVEVTILLVMEAPVAA